MKTTIRDCHTHGAAAAPRWDKEQIRAARMVAIAPLLEKRGLHLLETGGGNYTVREHPGLVIKDSYWRWPERGMGGNTMDLYMQVLRLSFNDAMLELSQTNAGLEGGVAPETS
jgi:hypothetical protein